MPREVMFRGVGTALITPFRDDGSLDEAAHAKFVDWQITEGINFLVPCGTTGENPTLTAAEHRRVVELTVQTSKGRVPVLAGAGSNSTTRAVELAREAVDLDADRGRASTRRRAHGADVEGPRAGARRRRQQLHDARRRARARSRRPRRR